MRRIIATLLCLIIFLSACSSPVKVDLQATETQIASNIFATLTASAPTATLKPNATPTLAPTATPLPSPTLTPQPTVPAVVKSVALNFREGPDTTFPVIQGLKEGDKLNVVGQIDACSWLKVILQNGATGWVKGNVELVDLKVDCKTIPIANFRPTNGMLLLDKRTALGQGQLKVNNGTSADCAILMMKPDNTLLVAFFVRSSEDFALFGVPAGKYQVYFMQGQDWDANAKKFNTNLVTRQITQTLEYLEKGESPSVWDISLQAAWSSLPISDVALANFPIIK
ncbi:MAG: SH3 domain-containing protein [Planctomycetes bacterium]|nr:SH3 domain-containing protein [Planctomycetota bacterium]